MNLVLAQDAVFASLLGANEKLVVLAILNHWSRARTEPFPSVERLTKWTSLSRCSVMRAIRHLEAAGAITVRRRQGAKNKYALGALTSLPQRPVSHSDQSPTATSLVGPVSHSDQNQSLGETLINQGIDQSSSSSDQSPRATSLRERRARGQQPIVRAGLIDTRVKARDWNAPPEFADYAAELGLDARQYSDVIADFHEKVSRAAGPPWLASQLCRFIEQKAGKLVAGVRSAGATAQHHEKAEDWQ